MKHSKHSKKRTAAPRSLGRIWDGVKIGLILILLALLVFVAAKYLPQLLSEDGLQYEANATIGTVGDGAEQIEQMNEMLDKGMLTMSINASPVWELSNKEAGVNWQIENPAEQANKLIRVEIYLDETGKKIYETGAIRPGTYITGTKPAVDLDVGTYSCTAYFYSYDLETQDFLGRAGAQIRLTVQP